MHEPWDEEVFFEPGPHDEAIETFVDAIKDNVKQELKDELRRLRQENTELRKLRDSYNDIVQEYRIKERALEFEKSRILETVRRERLQTIMKDFEVILYRPDYDFKKGPKCDRCDEDRLIHYLNPLEERSFVECPCGKNRIKQYKTRGEVCTSFTSRSGKFMAWYKPYTIDNSDGFEFYGSSNTPNVIYSGEDFESIADVEYYNLYFKTEEECQGYCDWLTAKEAENK